MCVVAIKKVGVAFPNDTSIKAMWDTNSDGAGIMYALDNKVYIEKGFMKLADMDKAIKNLSKKLKKKDMTLTDLPMVLHFRITTHGGTSPEMTHPFPISSQEKHLKALDLTCDLALAHNGIITSVPVQAGLSDTATYIANVLTPLAYLNKDFYMNKEGKAIMENTIGASKFAILDKNGTIETIGDFKYGTKNDTDTILFSNLSHEWDIGYMNSVYTRSSYPSVYGSGYYDALDTAYTDDFAEKLAVKKLPVGTIIVNELKFFDNGNLKDYEKFSKVINDKDDYYIDKYGYVYNTSKNGYLKESDFYDGVVKVNKDNFYVHADLDDFDNVKLETKNLLY
jgi:predicted glutamine amidotransferase